MCQTGYSDKEIFWTDEYDMAEIEISPEEQRHKELCDLIHNVYIQKNKAYGNSFSRNTRKFGMVCPIMRIGEKYDRAENIVLHPEVDTGDEKLTDTLLDLANYCLMTVIEIEHNQSK